MKLRSFPLAKQHSIIVLLIAFFSLMAFAGDFFIGDSATQVFIYHRDLIAQGEVWRLFTAHLLHTNSIHLLLNLAALTMLWALHGHFYTIKNSIALFMFCALFTSLGIFYATPSLIQYVGLSGVLHGVFVFGAIMDINAKDKSGYLLFIGVWLKIAHEQIYGASSDISDLIEANVAIDAHLWGAVSGLVFTIAYLIIIRLNKEA